MLLVCDDSIKICTPKGGGDGVIHHLDTLYPYALIHSKQRTCLFSFLVEGSDNPFLLRQIVHYYFAASRHCAKYAVLYQNYKNLSLYTELSQSSYLDNRISPY